MNHLLHHVGDQVHGTVDVYLDVGSKDLNLTREQQTFIKAAVSNKRKVGAVVRQHTGTSFFAYSGPPTLQDEMRLIASMAAILGGTLPTVNVETSPDWERY